MFTTLATTLVAVAFGFTPSGGITCSQDVPAADWGMSVPAAATVELAPTICDWLAPLEQGEPTEASAWNLGVAVHVEVHELEHVKLNSFDDCRVETAANEATPRVLMALLGQIPQRMVLELADAGSSTFHAALPAVDRCAD